MAVAAAAAAQQRGVLPAASPAAVCCLAGAQLLTKRHKVAHIADCKERDADLPRAEA